MTALAKLFGESLPPQGQIVPLAADTLVIDGIEKLFTITFRGTVPIPSSETIVRSMRAQVGIESTGSPIEWPSALTRSGSSAALPAPPPALLVRAPTPTGRASSPNLLDEPTPMFDDGESVSGSTKAITPEEAMKLLAGRAAALPFGGARLPGAPLNGAPDEEKTLSPAQAQSLGRAVSSVDLEPATSRMPEPAGPTGTQPAQVLASAMLPAVASGPPQLPREPPIARAATGPAQPMLPMGAMPMPPMPMPMPPQGVPAPAPMRAPPMQAPPMQPAPMQAPPMQPAPMQAPPMQAPPMMQRASTNMGLGQMPTAPQPPMPPRERMVSSPDIVIRPPGYTPDDEPSSSSTVAFSPEAAQAMIAQRMQVMRGQAPGAPQGVPPPPQMPPQGPPPGPPGFPPPPQQPPMPPPPYDPNGRPRRS